MLKWAVNGSHIRESHLQEIQFDNHQHNNYDINHTQISNQPKSITTTTRRSLSNININSCHIKREKLRRKSSGHELQSNINRNILIRDKENHLTSTPLPLTKHHQQINNNNNSPIRKLDSLKDLSNITTNESFMVITPNQTPTNKFYNNSNDILTTPNTLTKNNNNNNPVQYATTLPTFDIEYSPCSIIPGPLLALRGIGIADSYFEKPRYLPHEFPGYRKRPITNNKLNHINDDTMINYNKNEPLPKRFHHIQNNINCKNNITEPIFNNNNNNNNYDESLSSSKMSDTTLDKMIDAILESARKERRIPKSKQLHIMSPTYTPADDPASDLNEFWDEPNSIYRQNNTKINNYNLDDPGGTSTIVYNEREVRTPDYYLNNLLNNLPNKSIIDNENNNINNNDNNISCHLRRQRAVRRKRKLSIASSNFIKSTVKNSAQKLFGSHNTLLRKNHDQLNQDTEEQHHNNQNQQKKPKLIKDMNDFSPDSGRNSPSDFDESNDENHCTKRRLSFSPI